MHICNFETNFEVSFVFWCQLIILNSIMCHNNTMNSFTIARTPKLVFNETGKIKNMQISIHVLYMHVLYMYIMQWENSFFSYAAPYYATPRHNHRSDFVQNGLKLSARLERKKSSSLGTKK